MEDLTGKVLETIRLYNLIKPRELVIVGVSGGPDSLALLHILNRLKNELDFLIHVAHLDHSFRGKEAEEEAVWVKETARSWGLDCTLAKTDVPVLARAKGLSPQDAGHIARKEFFLDLKKNLKAQRIALGHHADDQAETLLMHFLKGTGSEGLRGIKPMYGPWIRPLLFIRREEIEYYGHEHGLNPRRDPSNKKNIYLRNKIRNQLVPWIQENINPSLVETLNRTAQVFWAEEEYFQELTVQAAETCIFKEKGKIVLALNELRRLPLALQRRIIRQAYNSLEEKHGLPFLHVEETRELAGKKQVGKTLCLPGKVIAERTYNTVEFYHINNIKAVGSIKAQLLNIPGSTYIPETKQVIEARISDTPPDEVSKEIVSLPFNGDSPKLFVRSRQEGDRFSPKGLNKSKKLKEFFIDNKIPRRDRDMIVLVTNGEEVLWIPGVAVSSRVNNNGIYEKYLILSLNKSDANFI